MHNASALFWLGLGLFIVYEMSKNQTGATDIPAYIGAGPYPVYGPPVQPAGPCPAGMQWVLQPDQTYECMYS